MNDVSPISRQPMLSLPESVKYTISALICIAGVVSMYLLMQLRESTPESDSDALIPLVQTTPVQEFDGKLDLVVSGTVVPYREIKIGAEVSGRILKKYPVCEAGNFVRKGQKLLEIDPVDYELEIKTMDAEIHEAEKTMSETEEEIRGSMRSLEISQTDVTLQRNELERFENLGRSISASELDQVKRNLLTSQGQLTSQQNQHEMLLARKERLKATMALIKNRKEKAQLNLERTVVTAPEDGVIVRESVEQGDYVSVSQELFVFEETSRAEVLCSLTPGELAWIRRYAPPSAAREDLPEHSSVYQLPNVDVEVFEGARSEIRWSGVLQRFDGIGRNETTKSIPCRIGVPIPVIGPASARHVLVRGMYVKCRIVLPSRGLESQLASIPSLAVLPGDYVWAVRDKKLKRIDVDVIDRTPSTSSDDEEIVVVRLIEGKLTTRDKVVVTPLPQPTDGGRVIEKQPESVATSTPVASGVSQRKNVDTSSSAPESSELRTNTSAPNNQQQNDRSHP